jgi:hypothetical protein
MPTVSLTKVAGSVSLSSEWVTIEDDGRVNIQHAVAPELAGPGIEITKIEIRGRARNSSSAAKNLRLGFKPALNSGRDTWATFGGGNVLDSSFTAIDGSSSGSYIYRTFTRVYDENTNAAAFAKFAGHIRESFISGNPVYLGIIQPTAGRSISVYISGYWTITITYNILGNVPSTNVNEAVVGTTPITTTIEKIVPDSTTTLNYKYDSTVLKTVNLAAGTSDVYTPPQTIATTHFPNDLTGTLTIEAKTYLGGVEYGTVITTVTLTLPASAAPTCLCTPTMLAQVISGVNAYVQNQSGVQFSVSGSAKLGASIAGYSLSFDGAMYDTFPAVIPLLTHSGTLSYTLTVTDSRGLTGTASGSIYVYPWQKPVFLIGFACARATLSGDIDDDAESVLYTMSVAASPIEVGGVQYNTLSYQIKSRPIGTETWDLNDPVCAPAGDYALNPEELIMRGGNVAAYTAYQGYEFVVTVQDLFDSAQGNYTIPTNKRQFVLGQDGESFAYGGPIIPGQGTFYKAIELLGGIKNLANYSSATYETGLTFSTGCIPLLGICWGVARVTSYSAEVGNVWVNYPEGISYKYRPIVMAIGQSTVPKTLQNVTVSDFSDTGFRIYIHRSSTTASSILWVAIGEQD